jgi:hypothetical protein
LRPFGRWEGFAVATISSLLADHVSLRVRSVDRIFLAGYVPRLQCDGQLVRYLNDRAGGTIPSPAILGRVGRAYVEEVNRFAKAEEIPVVRFAKSDVKEDVARPYMQAAEREGRCGVVLLGVAQEKAFAWRGWRDGGHDAHPHFEFARQAVFVNHHYFYVFDPEWGPSFVKTNAYAPYPIWVYLNGHEWAKRQAAREGVQFKPLDNGFAACDHAERLAGICDRLSERDIFAFCDRWMRRLPSPFTEAERGRYGYRYSVRQVEMSDTRVFDKPAAGRAWFEQTIRDQLDLGRPDKVQIVFDRRINSRTPGRFQTKVITKGVEPVIQAHYRHSKVKQYFKEGRALRTETTVNDPYDFGVNRTLSAETWQQLRSIGDHINDRLLDAQLQACSCAPDPTTLTRLVSPSIDQDGQPAPALHFGDPRVMALLACLCSYQHLFAGLTNRTLRPQIAEIIPGYTRGQMTYDLRRLRRKGLIRRIPRSQRYELTTFGRRTAVFFTKTYVRIVNPSLAELDPHLPEDIANHHPLAQAWRAFERALDTKIKQAAIAA